MAWREDSDLHYRVEQVGKLVPVPDAVVVHPVRPAPWGVSLGQQRKNVFNALLFKKHPELYRQRIQPSPPWRYYMIVGALLAATAFSLRRRRGPALVAVGVWGSLTGQFGLERLEGTSHAPRHVAEMAVTSALIPPLAIFWRIWGARRYRVFFL